MKPSAHKERRLEYTRRFNERHPEKRAEWTRKWREANPDHASNYRKVNAVAIRAKEQLKRFKQHGITEEDFLAMAVAQGHSCAICKRPEAEMKKGLNVDHDHETGKVRGLLCVQCNTAIGLLDDDFDLLRAAIAYLAKAVT